MAKATWNLDVNGEQHTVVLEWTYFGGERTVSVGGHVVEKSDVPLRWESAQDITVGSEAMQVVTRPQAINVTAFDVELKWGDRVLKPDTDDR